jgi:hypothetical protein
MRCIKKRSLRTSDPGKINWADSEDKETVFSFLLLLLGRFYEQIDRKSSEEERH